MVTIVMALLTSCFMQNDLQTKSSYNPNHHDEYSSDIISAMEKNCFNFFKEEMITQEGGVRTNYLNKEHNVELATGAEVLSESLGLLMLYAVEINDEGLLKNSLDFIEKYLDTGEIISYRYSGGSGVYHVNALVDDLRIIRALILANDAFGGGYLDIALEYSQRIYSTNIKESNAYDIYDEYYKITNNFITLCYIDLYSMKLLGKYNQKWTEVFDVMSKIAKEGYISDDFPMFFTSYNYSQMGYKEGPINMVEATLTALNLARVNECPQETIIYLKDSLKKGAIYSTYSNTGEKKSNIESTAIYAICAMIAKEVDDEEMYRTCIGKVSSFQVTDESSEVYGAFANAKSLDLYSFDNLMALLAYRQR